MERASLRRHNYLTNKPRISVLQSDINTCDGSELKELLRQFELHCNQINYAAYRSAAKLQLVQKVLKFHQLQLGLVTHYLDSQGYGNIATNNRMLNRQTLLDLIDGLYAHRDKMFTGSIGSPYPSQLLVNLLFHLFERANCGEIDVLSLKVALAIFTASKPIDKYKYLFQQFKDLDNTLHKQELANMLYHLAKVPEMLGEKLSFGTQLVPAAVESCFYWNGKSHEGLSEENFLSWMMQEPQTLVWISTHYRLMATQNMEHTVRCNICKVYPILGLRYRCLECFNFNLCQACFMTGATAKGHKVKHQLQEYCQPASSWEETKLSFRTIKRKLNLAHKNRQSYLSINPFLPQTPTGNDEDCAQSQPFTQKEQLGLVKTPYTDDDEDEEDFGSKKDDVHFCWRELESIIIRLEDENKQLQSEIEKMHVMADAGSSGESQRSSQGSVDIHRGMILSRQEMLEDHSHQLELQVQRLKKLQKLLTMANGHSQTPYHIKPPLPTLQKIIQHYASTPNNNVQNSSSLHLTPSAIIPNHPSNLSSITVHPIATSKQTGLSPQIPLDDSSVEIPRRESLQFTTFRSSPSSSSFTNTTSPPKMTITNSFSFSSVPTDCTLYSTPSFPSRKEATSGPSLMKEASKGASSISVPGSLKFTFADVSPLSSAMAKNDATSPSNQENTKLAWNQVDYELQTIIDQLEKILPQSYEISATSSFSRSQAMNDLQEAKMNTQGITTHC